MKKIICEVCNGEKFQLRNDYLLEYAAHSSDLKLVILPVVCLSCNHEFEVEFEPKGITNENHNRV